MMQDIRVQVLELTVVTLHTSPTVYEAWLQQSVTSKLFRIFPLIIYHTTIIIVVYNSAYHWP